MKFILSAFADEAAVDLNGQITALKENGLKNIEVRNVDGKGIIFHSKDEWKEISKKLADNGISVSSIGSPIGKIKIDEAFAPHLETFKQAAECAQALNCKQIRMFSFYMPGHQDPNHDPKKENYAAYKDEVFKRLDAILQVAKAQDVLCCHENEKGIYGDIGERCLELYEAFTGRMSAVFDPANFVQCKEKPFQLFQRLEPYVTYMHIKDATLDNGSVVPAGFGDGDIQEIISKIDREMVLSLEPHLKVFDGLAQLQAEEIKHKFSYNTSMEAFAAATKALKEILTGLGASFE